MTDVFSGGIDDDQRLDMVHQSEVAGISPNSGQKRRPRTDWLVFGVTTTLTLAFVVWGAVATDVLQDVSAALLAGVIGNGGWGFVLATSGFVIFALWIAFSRYGRIRLGADGEEPEFRTVSWIAMMFSTGMGIGLMFYGVNEPLAHFTEPPPGTHGPGDPAPARIETAMATTLFHWTLHPWAIYSIMGLAIAYSAFRRGRRQTISSVFTPLIGRRNTEGPVGKVIDILAIFATLFGSAASLGIGALQIGSGLTELGWVTDFDDTLLVLVIAALTLAFVASAVSGIARGIQWLANINMVLAFVLLVFVFLVGPTVQILNMIPTSIGAYLGELPQLVGRTEATGGPGVDAWLAQWTIFYWAWWISWTPFVGMFIARISRGRTIRQFVGGVILAPCLVSLVWFAVFGGTSTLLQARGVPLADAGSPEAQMFTMLREFPIFGAVSVLVIVLIAIFFVTGADSASLVMGTLSQHGTLDPTRPVVIVWGVLTGGVAAIMLIIGGGGDAALTGLQNLTILVSVPFLIVLVLMCVALTRDLRRDPLILRSRRGREVVEAAVDTGRDRYDGDFVLDISPCEPDGEARARRSVPGSG
ncbi:BCCT family transporter [Actinomadura flavalba]|uniref:BCCT family transporter n=1 Tax=Actinomadura flavalba TaxID=1120938 RepID=UPI001F0B0FE1|nr:BCCT family transporter [Actinomadura flavalba]